MCYRCTELVSLFKEGYRQIGKGATQGHQTNAKVIHFVLWRKVQEDGAANFATRRQRGDLFETWNSK